ncbi:uncharacterized protein ACDP82_008605 [Pangshura tecta]
MTLLGQASPTNPVSCLQQQSVPGASRKGYKDISQNACSATLLISSDSTALASGEVEVEVGLETDSEAAGVGRDSSESQEACSQELFSSQEEASQLQHLELGEEESQEQVPVSLTSPRNGPVLSETEKELQNLRRKPKKSKEDLVKAVMNQCARDSKSTQDWREKIQHWKETQSRRKELLLKETTRQLISLMARQTDCIQSLVAMQAKHYRANLPAQTSCPCAPMLAPNPPPQHPGSYLHHHQLPPTPVRSPISPENYDLYPLHSTPITMQHYNPEVHSTPGSTYANL